MSAAKMLTAKQIAALGGMSAGRHLDARTIGAHTATCASLVTLGLASSMWFSSSLKGGETKGFRLTGRGVVALRGLQRAGLI